MPEVAVPQAPSAVHGAPDDGTAVARALLVIGIHRQELAFGQRVAQALRAAAAPVDVLEIPKGLSGRRPRPDELFRYETLHKALYSQLLPHVRPAHRLVIDLHTGEDAAGPCADLFSARPALRDCLRQALAPGWCAPGAAEAARVRVLPLGDNAHSRARTVIPPRVWDNPRFGYLAIEVYLAGDGPTEPAVALATALVQAAIACAG